jgi:hypothetical protein
MQSLWFRTDLDKEFGEDEKMGSPEETEPSGLASDHRDKVVAAGAMEQVGTSCPHDSKRFTACSRYVQFVFFACFRRACGDRGRPPNLTVSQADGDA